VSTDHPALARYLEDHFSQLRTGGAAAGDPDVSVRVRWTEGPREPVRPETVFPDWPVDTMIDRHVHVGPNRAMWLRVDDVGPLAVPGAELLADNVVLHDGRQIYGCFEPLLLDEQSRTWLGQRAPLRALGRRHVFARDAYHVPHRTGGLPPGAVVVLARGRETRLTPIDSGMCARTLLAINEVAKEVRRYHVL